MEYLVHTLASKGELESCPRVNIANPQWNCVVAPQAWGQMGYLPEEGFLLQMGCRQNAPLRSYTQNDDPVCKDDALEAFFAFGHATQPPDDCLYLNLEINANGVMHAKHGLGRKGRTPFTAQEYAACRVSAWVEEESWGVRLLLPLPLLERLYGISTFTKGDAFYYNWYKICETPANEHYLSFSPIKSDTPNFHKPSCFARAVLV